MFQQSTKACIQSQTAAVVVTMDTEMDTLLRDRLVHACIPNNDDERSSETMIPAVT